MTILASLARLYDRMAKKGEAPRPGFSTENISFAVVLDGDGTPLRLADKRSHAGKKPAPVPMAVPEPPKDRRGLKIVPGFLWDPSPYSLGVSVDAEKKLSLTSDNARDKFAAFREKHLELLKDTDDFVLLSVAKFLENWNPADIEHLPGFSLDLLKTNIVFEIDAGGERGFAHERASIRKLPVAVSDAHTATCLVSGEVAPVTRLHPMFGGISDKQAAIVSFNIGSKDERGAASSYGKIQGDNAPISEDAAFAYGTALNALLARGSSRNIRIADTTAAFWAEAPDPAVADFGDWLMGAAVNPPDEQDAINEMRAALVNLSEGRAGDDPRLDPEARIYMLGLAPNAARLSVRFWCPGTMGGFARHVTQFWQDLDLAPTPWKGPPAVWSLLYETALLRKAENIPPLLGGQVMRAVLTGQPLPRMLLSAVIGRIRADGDINGRRAAICKAVINRTSRQEEIPVSLDPENTNPAYRLGRLFAVLERAQSSALPGLNATIKDRYFAAASATPARVFPLLVKNATHHLALLKKGESGGIGHWLEKELGTIWLGLGADMPRALSLEDQGRFIAGYYHQRWTKSTKEKEAK